MYETNLNLKKPYKFLSTIFCQKQYIYLLVARKFHRTFTLPFYTFLLVLSRLSTSFCRHDLIGVFSTTINELKSTPGITYEVRLLQINKLIFCKDRNTGYNVRKNDTRDLVPNFSRTDGFKYSFFNRVVDEWNGLPNHIRESNSIATFKRNVLGFIKDN